MDSSEMSNLDKNIGSGFDIWKREVQNKHASSGSGPDCTNVAQCRVYEEVVLIAWCKLKKLRKLIPSDVFLMKFDKRLQQGGSSKFQMVFSGTNVGQGMESAGIFKLCVPTDRTKTSFLIYACALSDCEANYEQALECSNKVLIPKKSVDFKIIEK